MARIIARLNVGGPAIQAIALTRRLEPLGYDTLLIRGSEAPREGSMDHLAAELDVRPLRIARMGRELGLGDVAAFVSLVRVLRRLRPDIVHTHAAKAGTLGRLAALVPGRGPPARHRPHVPRPFADGVLLAPEGRAVSPRRALPRRPHDAPDRRVGGGARRPRAARRGARRAHRGRAARPRPRRLPGRRGRARAARRRAARAARASRPARGS